MHRRLLLALALAASVSAQYPDGSKLTWIEPGSKVKLDEVDNYDNSLGALGILYASGPVTTDGHPFFTPLGTNGRACINCHQPTYGMSVSAAALQDRWRMTDGKDPVFAAFDGSNCPGLPQDQASSHSLLLQRGLFRIPLAWPPKNADGSPKPVEFKIEVVRDPTGCNNSREYGIASAQPTVSVYRRPRPAANLKFVTAGGGKILLDTLLNPGLLADVDPETSKPVSMNLMTDAREVSLKSQALSAIMGHEQARTAPSREQLEKIVEFESQVYTAQATHVFGGALAGGSVALGPNALLDRQGAGSDREPVFGTFKLWKTGTFSQASIARGADIFMYRQFWLRDSAHVNSTGLGNPIKATCATCHSTPLTGQAPAAGWIDVGTTNFPNWTEPATWSESSELPVFKITCAREADPHPYLGRVIYTTDPGRALISGKCADVGSIVMQQLRGLAARAPYFANGSAKSLREVIDFYDRRFDVKLTDAEKDDLLYFLGAL